ncbi:hypothetical protein ABFX02_01G099600 [Erythranthe guttata]
MVYFKALCQRRRVRPSPTPHPLFSEAPGAHTNACSALRRRHLRSSPRHQEPTPTPAPPFANAPSPFSDASGAHNNATFALRRATSVVTPPPTLINCSWISPFFVAHCHATPFAARRCTLPIL